MQVNEDGSVLVATGSPDIGGSRASMAIMAAETLGVDYNQVRAIVADTGSIATPTSPVARALPSRPAIAVVDADEKSNPRSSVRAPP